VTSSLLDVIADTLHLAAESLSWRVFCVVMACVSAALAIACVMQLIRFGHPVSGDHQALLFFSAGLFGAISLGGAIANWVRGAGGGSTLFSALSGAAGLALAGFWYFS